MNKYTNKYTFIDFFCGCGGLTEGFLAEGYEPLLLSDIDKYAMETSSRRLSQYGYDDSSINRICKIADLSQVANIKSVLADLPSTQSKIDLIAAGIPCQSFSSVGRAQDRFSMKKDARNYLYKSLLKYISILTPTSVLIENVSGLLTAKPDSTNPIIEQIFTGLRLLGYDVHRNVSDILLNSGEYGVPQIRKRVIIFGVRVESGLKAEYYYNNFIPTHFLPESNGNKRNLKKYVSVREAIGDLPILQPGEGAELVADFKPHLNHYLKLIRKPGYRYLHNHFARTHNEHDKKRYRLLAKHNWQLKDLELHYPELVHHDPRHFGNRYTVQEYDLPGRTVVSHLYKDGNLFIHPDYQQNRTFTVREAARIQSFPDDFVFYGSRTEQYKQVGNAVPVMFAKVLARAHKALIER
jgi:DNA (cytosine-5)-methyltransferase 1